MLAGGIMWGVMGDKKGRVSVLFGSILLYSLANLANAFVTTTSMYGVLRFIAGVGLAGELGAAITLVSETLRPEVRGYGTSFVAGFGVSGAMLASIMAESTNWQIAYIVGGVMGLLLLGLRMRLFESKMYSQTEQANVKKGSILLLFSTRERCTRYLLSILIGMPTWFVIGILITFSPEICKALGATETVSAGTGILAAYGGLVVGDFFSGLISQWLKSRRHAVFAFVTAAMVLSGIFLTTKDASALHYYTLCFILGIASGYWALFVTIAAEQFGTNLRALVATTVPNVVRGSGVIFTTALTWLRQDFDLITSVTIVGVAAFAVTYLALWKLKETFSKDLDFLEHQEI
jgi:MFS family permease